jgi:hypothetical protein
MGPPEIHSTVDFNRDKVVDVQDKRVVSQNKTKRKSFLALIVAE